MRGPGTLQAGGAQYLPGHRQTFKTETRPQNRMRLQAQRGLFSRTKSSPARAASSNADETTEPGAAAAAGKVRTRVHQEGDYKEDIDRNTQRGRASLSTPGLASAMAKSAISSEEFSRTRSSPSSATSSKSLETSQHGGSLSGAQHILSRRAAFAEPAAYSAAAAAGNVRMRLDKEGALHPSATKFHGGFLDGNIFGRNSSILESRFRWRTAASSTISHFHSIPSESFGLDTPEMQRKLAELERSLADDDADAVNTQVPLMFLLLCISLTSKITPHSCGYGNNLRMISPIPPSPHDLTQKTSHARMRYSWLNRVWERHRACATACARYSSEARSASLAWSRARRARSWRRRARASCAPLRRNTWTSIPTGLRLRPSML